MAAASARLSWFVSPAAALSKNVVASAWSTAFGVILSAAVAVAIVRAVVSVGRGVVMDVWEGVRRERVSGFYAGDFAEHFGGGSTCSKYDIMLFLTQFLLGNLFD